MTSSRSLTPKDWMGEDEVGSLVVDDPDFSDELRPLALLGRPVDVAAACGLGRRADEAAVEVMRRTAALCTD